MLSKRSFNLISDPVPSTVATCSPFRPHLPTSAMASSSSVPASASSAAAAAWEAMSSPLAAKKIKANSYSLSPMPSLSSEDSGMEIYFDRDPTPTSPALAMASSASFSRAASNSSRSSSSNSSSSIPPALPTDLDTLIIDSIPATIRKKRVPIEEQQFSYSDLKTILQAALQERESQIRQEYDVVLNQLLREQFDAFTKFNQDYIHRQLKRSDSSYLS